MSLMQHSMRLTPALILTALLGAQPSADSIEQGLDGNLYVVSITDGAIYKISKK